MATLDLLDAMLRARLEPRAQAWLDEACAEVAAGAADERFVSLIALTSRHVRRGPLAPSEAELAAAQARLSGWNPERWDRVDAARARLLLSHPRLDGPEGEQALEEGFRYADVGEQVALYRALALLPRPERFAWRAGEGARSNMRAVFEATCCDTPYPARWFDDVAWRSAVLKALFVGAPLWRVHGLDGRLDAELARMALDYVEERRSAGRGVPGELWLCLGAHGGARATAALERELAEGGARGRAGAALGLVRARTAARAREAAAGDPDPAVRAIIAAALERGAGQAAFAALEDLQD